MKTIHSSIAVVALLVPMFTGCASNVRVARAPSASHPIAALFIPAQQQEPEQEVTTEIHASLTEEMIAALDAQREDHASQDTHLNGEHVARALPFECAQPFAIGICAVAPATDETAGGDQ
jgi:hypothetical protein